MEPRGKQWVTALHSSIALLQEIQTVAESQRDEGGEGSKWKQPMTLPRGQPLATTRQHNRRWFVHPDLIHPSRPPNHWLVVSIDPEYCTDLGAYNSDGEAKSTLHFTCERYTSACLISAGVAEFSFSLSWLFACLGLLVAQINPLIGRLLYLDLRLIQPTIVPDAAFLFSPQLVAAADFLQHQLNTAQIVLLCSSSSSDNAACSFPNHRNYQTPFCSSKKQLPTLLHSWLQHHLLIKFQAEA
ncbi:hypothetical protein HPP92_023651 [Vanilla planifolia]|uniref:Uncharacterized protein n=1 Tax=Vanilla planifolia TaxID=51239 RepID=A0A835PRV8_VANPL|nr:hypothetical protein HPP92_023651 [Vanilla planifolia]